jgi:hypothetical protein
LELRLSFRSPALRLAAFATLTPPIALLAVGGPPYSAALTLTLWVVLMGWAVEAARSTGSRGLAEVGA